MPLNAPIAWRRLDASKLRVDAAVSNDWDRLNALGLNQPFMSAQAVANALEIFGIGREQLLVGSVGGSSVAMFVLVPQGRLRWQTFQPSQMPLGAWVSGGQQPGIDQLAGDLLRSGALGLCLALSVTQIDPLQSPRQEDGPASRHSDYIDTAWLEVEGDFDTYWNARGKNLRQNLRKQRNKLASDGTATEMRLFRDEKDMGPALQRYGGLESQGWKAQQGTAIHPDNEQGRFYGRLLAEAARRNEALFTEYLFGEQTVAMNFGLVRDGTWVVLKTTYDESIPKSLSPASLLREDELKFVFAPDSGLRRIEYYGRMMDWHTKLTDSHRRLYHLTTYRWPWLKSLAERRRERAKPTAVQAAAEGEAAT
ncbi:Acetyltransf_6 domain-containing protein [Rubrivivax sp. A210]|uniref:GNAT family N-acetyltransferase n=1 Tax=Rubrivivax sp. A210 TaxID=2772301 RepID=UPI0019195A61|nr:GNAT family N-acetyltransferase [Rubrivivax sp. A210]CAD5375227.1 Acetyltransf_6 domain-containing protein [Rubrivivax sp. A210]